jgi:molybdopterin synthase catalytic subunit
MVEITDQPIDVAALWAIPTDPACGATVVFIGTTRAWTGTVPTQYLHYEAYEPMALAQMRELEEAARGQWPLGTCHMVHRVGRVDVGQPSIAVAVSAPHRAEAFAAAEWLVERLKAVVPIWKQEHAAGQAGPWVHPRPSPPDGHPCD